MYAAFCVTVLVVLAIDWLGSGDVGQPQEPQHKLD